MTADTDAELDAIATFVREHPDLNQSVTIAHTMADLGRSYGYWQRRVKRAERAGLIVARREGSHLYLRPPS